MARESTPKAIRGAGEKAAMELLRRRAAVIGQARVLQHQRDQLLAQLDEITDAYTTALGRARDAGWTVDELHQLDLDDTTDVDSGRRRRPARPVTRTPPTTPPTTDPDADADYPPAPAGIAG